MNDLQELLIWPWPVMATQLLKAWMFSIFILKDERTHRMEKNNKGRKQKQSRRSKRQRKWHLQEAPCKQVWKNNMKLMLSVKICQKYLFRKKIRGQCKPGHRLPFPASYVPVRYQNMCFGQKAHIYPRCIIQGFINYCPQSIKVTPRGNQPPQELMGRSTRACFNSLQN